MNRRLLIGASLTVLLLVHIFNQASMVMAEEEEKCKKPDDPQDKAAKEAYCECYADEHPGESPFGPDNYCAPETLPGPSR